MKKLVKSKKLWTFFVALVTTFSIGINVVNGSFQFNGNNFEWVLVLGVLCVLCSKALEKSDKRLLICSRNI